MKLFEKNDLQSLEVVVQGVTFNLVEPSALALTRHYDRVADRSKEAVSIEDTSSFRKQVLHTEINFDLIAVCLADQYPETSHIEIYESLCKEINNFDDILKLSKAAEEVCSLKYQELELQDENSQDG